MEIKTLNGTDIQKIAKVFNASFADYFISFRLSQEQLKLKMLADKTDLSLSVGVFDEQQLIAFILHGYDTIDAKKVVYNGGTGVVPNKRGHGLTKQMYAFLVPLLLKHGIHKLLLEVISKNIPAITSYKKSGFKVTRELYCYTGEVTVPNTNKDIVIKELQRYNWELMESFWDAYPTWQNSKNVLNTIKDRNVSLAAYWAQQFVGYVIYDPTSKRIQQLAVHKNFRKKDVASSLILAITEKYGTTLSIINVDKNTTAMNAFFKKIGLTVNLEQFEMTMELSKHNGKTS